MEGPAWRENPGLWFGHVNLATPRRCSSRSINLGNCFKSLELSRDECEGILPQEAVSIAKGPRAKIETPAIASLVTQPPPVRMPKSKRKYRQTDFNSLVKEGYTVTNKDYFRNAKMPQLEIHE